VAEQVPFKHLVEGSSPPRLTKQNPKNPQICGLFLYYVMINRQTEHGSSLVSPINYLFPLSEQTISRLLYIRRLEVKNEEAIF
jgi:hypothetical protein